MMCVGLSAKVVKISNGTAVIDAGGAKKRVSSQLLDELEPGDLCNGACRCSNCKKSPMRTTVKPSSSWRNFYNENSQRDH